MIKIIGYVISLYEKLNTTYIVTEQFVWVEYNQLCRNVNTSLEIF
jgi:hypothetical protein